MGGHVTVGVVEDAPDGISLVLLFSSPGKRIGCWRVKGLKCMMGTLQEKFMPDNLTVITF